MNRRSVRKDRNKVNTRNKTQTRKKDRGQETKQEWNTLGFL